MINYLLVGFINYWLIFGLIMAGYQSLLVKQSYVVDITRYLLKKAFVSLLSIIMSAMCTIGKLHSSILTNNFDNDRTNDKDNNQIDYVMFK